MKRRNNSFESFCYRFKGGGGGGGKQPEPKRTAPPAAPPSSTQIEVSQASRDARKQAAKRKGIKSTILAGETGGYEQKPSRGTGVILGTPGG